MSDQHVRRAFAPLHNHSFRLFFAGQLASYIGDAFYAVALPWYVLSVHGGVVLIGIVLASYGIARAVTMLLGGHAGDRWRPWTVMMCADLWRAAALAGLSAVAALARPHLAILAPAAIVIGAGEGFFRPNALAITPAVVSGDELHAATALRSGANDVASLLGPALGGSVVALLGAGPAFGVDSASFLLSAATLLAVRTHQRSPSPGNAPATGPTRAHETEQAAPTLRGLLRSTPALWMLFALLVAANLGLVGMEEVALPALVHGPLAAGADGYGVILAASGLGALAGTLLAAGLPAQRRPAMTASAAFACGCPFAALVPYLGGLAPAAISLALYAAAGSAGDVLVVTTLQRWAPPRARARHELRAVRRGGGVSPVDAARRAVRPRAGGCRLLSSERRTSCDDVICRVPVSFLASVHQRRPDDTPAGVSRGQLDLSDRSADRRSALMSAPTANARLRPMGFAGATGVEHVSPLRLLSVAGDMIGSGHHYSGWSTGA